MSDRRYKITMGLLLAGILCGGALLGLGLTGVFEKEEARKDAEAAVIAQKKLLADNLKRSKDQVDFTLRHSIHIYPLNAVNNYAAQGTGTVVGVDEDGSWLLTNKHVCWTARKKILTDDQTDNFYPVILEMPGRQNIKAKIVRTGENVDLCLIRTFHKFKGAFSLAKKVTAGEKVYTYGWSGGQPQMLFGSFITTDISYEVMFGQASFKAWKGASGSPILNADNELVGILAAVEYNVFDADAGQKDVKKTYFIPLELVREFLEGVRL